MLASTTKPHMVKHQDQALDRTFAALADPTPARVAGAARRRQEHVGQRTREPFAMSLPAIMKHSRRAVRTPA